MQLFQELFEHLLLHCKNHQSDLQNQSHLTVVEALMRVMHEFLMFRAKEQQALDTAQEVGEQQEHETTMKPNVSMYYLPTPAG